jgi:hypothetical protein
VRTIGIKKLKPFDRGLNYKKSGLLGLRSGNVSQGVSDVGEDIPDGGGQEPHRNDYDDSDQDDDQSVLYQTLAFFFRGKKHGEFSFQKSVT